MPGLLCGAAKHLRYEANNMKLFRMMAPRLQAEALWVTHRRWLRKVRFLNIDGLEPEFIASICMSLTPAIFAPDDLIYGNEELFVIYRGVALYGGRVLTSGAVWGEDMLLESESLRSRASAKVRSQCRARRAAHAATLRAAR